MKTTARTPTGSPAISAWPGLMPRPCARSPQPPVCRRSECRADRPVQRCPAGRASPGRSGTGLALLQQALLAALARSGPMRRLEGGRLAEDIRGGVGLLEDLRLRDRRNGRRWWSTITGSACRTGSMICSATRRPHFYDEQRLAAEVALFADKCSIDEELVRLDSHLRQVGDVISARTSRSARNWISWSRKSTVKSTRSVPRPMTSR